MNKITAIIFALAITHALGQSCTDTIVATDLDRPANAGTDGSLPASLASCASLEGAPNACCAETYFDTFEADATDLKDTYETAAGERDQAILDARKAVADQRGMFEAFKLAATAAEDQLTAWASAPPTGVTADEITDIQSLVESLTTNYQAFFDDYTTRRTGFTTYQEERAACIALLLQTHAAAWCLPCVSDENQGNFGIDISSGNLALTLATDLVDRLVEACVPYIEASASQTDVFALEAYAAGIEGMAEALTQIAAENEEGIAAFQTAATPANPTGAQSTIPTGCDETGCDYITETFFSNGALNQESIIRGGDTVARRRMLPERRLQTGSAFVASADEIKFQLLFQADPANVGNPNDLSALHVGVFSCIVAFFVALLI